MAEKTTATISSYGKNKPAYRTPAPSGAGVHPFALRCKKDEARVLRTQASGTMEPHFLSYANTDELPKRGDTLIETPNFGR